MKISHYFGLVATATLLIAARPAFAQTWSVLPFNGHDDRLFTGDGDWAMGWWKAECGTTMINGVSVPLTMMVGVASSGAGSCGWFGCQFEWTDSILCATPVTQVNQTDAHTGPGNGFSYELLFGGADDRKDTSLGDWAYGLCKGECASTDVMTGLAQSMPSDLDGSFTVQAVCSNMPFNHGATACNPVNFSNGDNREMPEFGGDWDYGFYKGQCGPGRYVKGVAVQPIVNGNCGQAGCPGARVESILCCSPTT